MVGIVNRLEGALFARNQRISKERSKRSPGRHSWNFMKDKSSDVEKMSARIDSVETLVPLLKSGFPNLPPTEELADKKCIDKVETLFGF